MKISNEDKINGYRLATLPLFSGTQSPFINDNLKVSPSIPLDGVITQSLMTKKYTFTLEKDVVESLKESAVEKYRWVIAYGDPFLFPSSFNEESILAYGETSTFSFTFDESGRVYFIRIDLFDGSFPEGSSTSRISRILKVKTTADGHSEKMGYIVLFLMILFVVLILLAIILFGKKGV